VMFPALRIGYLIAPPALVKPFARAKWITDRHNPTLDQAALADFLREGHLERHIRRMRRLYGRRREVLVDAIHRHFGSAAECLGDDAGMHLMIRLNDPNLIQRAEAHRVRIDRSAQYYLGDAPPNEFVFGFSNIPERTIREGIKRLAAKTQ
jgi:GntR family transcriptional regulator/MocR family aminotransferase